MPPTDRKTLPFGFSPTVGATSEVAGARPGRSRLRPGGIIDGRWQIDAVLHAGPSACVYAATHTRNKRRAALKVLDDASDTLRERFRREAYVANVIGHPGAVKVDDDGVTDDGSPFLVMELVSGATLHEHLVRAGGALPPGDVVAWACEILDVLVAAHAKNIVHRDLKPTNLIVTNAGEAKVLDFGTACLCDAQASSAITSAGMVIGTPAFMSPEQALGRRADVDARSDLWSLGATMFSLLSGRHVHEAESVPAQVYAAMTKHARPLASVAPGVPPAVARIVDRALAFDRDDRWQDAASMREALRWALLGMGRDAPPSSRAVRSVPPARSSTANEHPTLIGVERATLPAVDARIDTFRPAVREAVVVAPAPKPRRTALFAVLAAAAIALTIASSAAPSRTQAAAIDAPPFAAVDLPPAQPSRDAGVTPR